jgi:hypothetical protein
MEAVMIFVKIPHTNDEDSDYHSFNNLREACMYLVNTKEEEFVICTESMDIPAQDYTYYEEDPR